MIKLVIQLSIIGDDTDFDWLLHVEETLTRAFGLDDQADVGGHEIGEGRFNIFVTTAGACDPVVARITTLLEGLGALPAAVIAEFLPDTQSYRVVHPESYRGDFSL